MLPNGRAPLPALLLGALVLAACADGVPTSPSSAPRPAPSLITTEVPGPVCETLTFDEFARGAYVTSVTAGPLTLAVSATAFSNTSGAVATQARAFDTDHVSLSANDGTDMEWSGAFSRCPTCSGLERTLMVDRLGTTSVIDQNAGGILTLSGFASTPGYYVESFTVVDNDLTEPGVRLLVDGTLAATATPLGDGSVQSVAVPGTTTITDRIEFVLGTAALNDGTGSGSIDNIRLCTNPDTGCTSTPGYWKNHAGYGPQADVLSEHLPIWLGTAGGTYSVQVTTAAQAVSILTPSGTNGILKLRLHLLAAKLNIANGANPSAISAEIDAADAFLATHSAGSWWSLSASERAQVLAWKSAFDSYNNGVIGPGHCS
jgi:hypothetical protein